MIFNHRVFVTHGFRFLRGACVCALAAAAAGCFAGAAAEAVVFESPVKVEVQKDAEGKWRLLRNGVPHEVYGVGRETNLELARQIGVNTIRTYDLPASGERHREARERISDALENGMLYIGGLHVVHEGRHGFSYNNPQDVQKQRERIRQQVRAWRDHPGVLIWGLGNEAEGPRTGRVHPEFWTELGELAKIVREEDPSRPIMTVIAGAGRWRVESVRNYCPDVDILGVNTYGGAPLISGRLDQAGWEKPFILTEFGPRGHWEVSKADWGAPIEPDSEDKAALYAEGYLTAKADPGGRFLGAVCFVWAQKQEVTSTWFGMFLETGEKTPAVDAIARVYSGKWPQNRSPRIDSLESELNLARVPPNTVFTATAEAFDYDGDPLSYQWKVVEETRREWGGGAHEEVPPTVGNAILEVDDSVPGCSVATLRTPAESGAYRLMVFVRDGKGNGAGQNIPFFVNAAQ